MFLRSSPAANSYDQQCKERKTRDDETQHRALVGSTTRVRQVLARIDIVYGVGVGRSIHIGVGVGRSIHIGYGRTSFATDARGTDDGELIVGRQFHASVILLDQERLYQVFRTRTNNRNAVVIDGDFGVFTVDEAARHTQVVKCNGEIVRIGNLTVLSSDFDDVYTEDWLTFKFTYNVTVRIIAYSGGSS